MKRFIRNVVDRIFETGKEAYVFAVEPECQARIEFQSDGPVYMYATDDGDNYHPLLYAPDGRIDQLLHLIGAVSLVFQPEEKKQKVSHRIRLSHVSGREELDATPIEVEVPLATEGLTVQQMVLQELARYGIGREDADEQDNDLAFEDDMAEFGDGYMEPDEPVQLDLEEEVDVTPAP